MRLGLPFFLNYVATYDYSEHRLLLAVSSTAPADTKIEKREDDKEEIEKKADDLLWKLAVALAIVILLLILFILVCRYMRSEKIEKNTNAILYTQVEKDAEPEKRRSTVKDKLITVEEDKPVRTNKGRPKKSQKSFEDF